MDGQAVARGCCDGRLRDRDHGPLGVLRDAGPAVNHVYDAAGDSPANNAGPSKNDNIEAWVLRAIKALQDGEKDFAEELMVEILYLIGRGPPCVSSGSSSDSA